MLWLIDGWVEGTGGPGPCDGRPIGMGCEGDVWLSATVFFETGTWQIG